MSLNKTSIQILKSEHPFEIQIRIEEIINENSINWVYLPWQTLTSKDLAILNSVEKKLVDTSETGAFMKYSELLTNTILKDFPAEIFLQRPTVVNVFLKILELLTNEFNYKSQEIILAVFKFFFKFACSLRLRINYYCDPHIAKKIPKSGMSCDSELQLQQLSLPEFCSNTIFCVIKFLNNSTLLPHVLKVIKEAALVVNELANLLISSISPALWFCNSPATKKINQHIQILFNSFSEIINYYGKLLNQDYFRTSYIFFLNVVLKLISHIVPLGISNQVLPKSIKLIICNALMDSSLYLMYPALHKTLHKYSKEFSDTEECDTLKIYTETLSIIKSMKSAVKVLKDEEKPSYSDLLKIIYSSIPCLSCHKNFTVITKFLNLAQNKLGYQLPSEDQQITKKIILELLANEDNDIQEFVYAECHTLVNSILAVHCNKPSWQNLNFLIDSDILTEIICHGAINKNLKVKQMSEDILMLFLKGQLKFGSEGWSKFLDILVPVLPLLQSHSDDSSTLGQYITKIFDPDIFSVIHLPFIEVVRGNVRLLFSSTPSVREKAIYRLICLIGKEKDFKPEIPYIDMLQNLKTFSLVCILEKNTPVRKLSSSYQENKWGINLHTVLETLRTPNIEPKMKKSAVTQISVIVTNESLQERFISENGLEIISNIFSKALVDKNVELVIPILATLKCLASSHSSIRLEVSKKTDIYLNILQALFLYHNNEFVKTDGAQVLALLSFNEQIVESQDTSQNAYNISLPYIISSKMLLPFVSNSHWETSINTRADASVLLKNNPSAFTFIRHFWIWEWNGGEQVLLKEYEAINDHLTLMINEPEFIFLKISSLYYCTLKELSNVQNSETNTLIFSSLDLLSLCIKLYNTLDPVRYYCILQLPWKNSFEKFFINHPSSEEEVKLFVNVIKFLQLYSEQRSDEVTWLNEKIQSIINSWSKWLCYLCTEDVDTLESFLLLADNFNNIEISVNSIESWNNFTGFIIQSLSPNETGHFNLTSSNYVLNFLSKCKWQEQNELLLTTGSNLLNIIGCFSYDNSFTFKGTSTIRNLVLSLNIVFNQLDKNSWTTLWFKEGQRLNWLMILWRNQDPLVQAYALQFFTSMISRPHTAAQLFYAIEMTATELVDELLYLMCNPKEFSIVKEGACLAITQLLKNSNSTEFQYMEMMNPKTIINYLKKSNIFLEINMMLNNCFEFSTLDPNFSEDLNKDLFTVFCGIPEVPSINKKVNIRYLYCNEDIQNDFYQNSEFNEDEFKYISTPSLITSICIMLNNFILLGGSGIINDVNEFGVLKHLTSCITKIPKSISGRFNTEHYLDVLEMNTNICRVLINIIVYNPVFFTSSVSMSSNFILMLLKLLNKDLYFDDTQELIIARKELESEIFKLLTLLIIKNPDSEAIQTSLKVHDNFNLIKLITSMITVAKPELRTSAIIMLDFLLSLEKQSMIEEKNSLKNILDEKYIETSNNSSSVKNIKISSTNPFKALFEDSDIQTNSSDYDEKSYFGTVLSKSLIKLYIDNENGLEKQNDAEKDFIIRTLTNLFCVSEKAKLKAIEENLPDIILHFLNTLFIQINSNCMQNFRCCDPIEKLHPSLSKLNSIFLLILNLMQDCLKVKEIFAKTSLADIIHKLWSHILTNKLLLRSCLCLLETFAEECPDASYCYTLTSATFGAIPTKTPNTASLIYTLIEMIIKEIEIGQGSDIRKISYVVFVLKNAVNNYDCRVIIARSDLLKSMSKFEPIKKKKRRQYQMNYSEFLLALSSYDEGQKSILQETQTLELIIRLAVKAEDDMTSVTAISVLKNLASNFVFSSRLLWSTEFLDLLSSLLMHGPPNEVEIVGFTLKSLISNNEDANVTLRSSGFVDSIRLAICNLNLTPNIKVNNKKEIIDMLEYILESIQVDKK